VHTAALYLVVFHTMVKRGNCAMVQPDIGVLLMLIYHVTAKYF